MWTIHLTSIMWILGVLLGLCVQTVFPAEGHNKTWKDSYDYIVVGGGAAGCVVAARLSEDPDVNVLLLEAGSDDTKDPFVKIPRGFHTVANTKKFSWGFKMERQKNARDREIEVNQAKLLGGCTANNAMNVIRGSPHDFDRWRDMGNKGWGYDDVLKYFKKSEDMLDPELAKNGYHGVGGPWQVRLAYKHPVVEEIMRAGKELGYEEIDQNGREEKGFFMTQNSVSSDGRRMSTSEAFLRPVMARRNLDVVLEAMVTKVGILKCNSKLMACDYKGHVEGVHFRKNDQDHFVKSTREVIVSAGTINSPKILMLSGVGPKEHLKEHKISVIANLPVGKNLQDHIIVPMWFHINATESIKKKMKRIHSFGALFEYMFKGSGPWSSYASQAATVLITDQQPKEDKFNYIEISMAIEVFDMNEALVNQVRKNKELSQKLLDELENYDKKKKYIATGPLLTHPRTRGTVKLRSANPRARPIINKQYFEHPDDIKDLLQGIRFIQKIMKTKVLKDDVGVEKFKIRNANCWKLEFDTDDWWKCYIRHTAGSSFAHYGGTCKMAPLKDKTGVVDDQLRVKGIQGLRVVDSSIMPNIVSGHTMAGTIMIAEKGSDMIKETRKMAQQKQEL